MKRRVFAALMCALPVAAWAAYPGKPVRLIVPFTPGSITDVVARINSALGKVLQSSSIQQQFASNGLTVRSSSPDDFRQLIASDIDKRGKIFVAAGLTPQ